MHTPKRHGESHGQADFLHVASATQGMHAKDRWQMSDSLHPSGSGEEYTADQMNRMLDLYERTLSDAGYSPVSYPDPAARLGGNRVQAARFDCLNHALWMCGCIRRLLREARYAKAYRWLGEVRGMLFMGGVFSIGELREQEYAALTPVPKRVRDALKECPPTPRTDR